MTDGEYTVLIVDDHDETRRNISKLLQFESDINVVGTAQSAKAGIQEAIELNPDVVLMDINMPDVDGIKATEAIRERFPLLKLSSCLCRAMLIICDGRCLLGHEIS